MNDNKILTLIFVAMLFMSQSISNHAYNPDYSVLLLESNNIISPQWVNVNDINLNFYIENGEANCSGKIRALSGTTNIAATFKLERKTPSEWVLEKTWSRSSSTTTLSFFETFSVLTGHKYRLSVTAKVTRNGVIEDINESVYSN